MGQKKKVGKQRKDKYYRLAKETGFRSRAAFKLLQLNRKFGFLESSRVLLDLCAAPGGWMQVAKQNMPVSSLIVGVDLFPIKPIPGCISLVEDITTSKCRSAISKALQTWKADVVLHDGAPNVGTTWIFDAYQQSCLTLSAFKLCTEFLREGGWFVTKVFRSTDYNSLIWVFKQLFNKVSATKPQASRSESAEIFVVCKYYKAPDKIDPKFFQPQYVFKELEVKSTASLNVFHPKKSRKKKALGYDEGDYTLHHTVNVSDFINNENAIEILQKASEIVFDDKEILNHPSTTNEIKECFRDIKVLNRKDVRVILNWRKKLIDEIKLKNEKEMEEKKAQEKLQKNNEEVTMSDEEEKELNEIDKHIADLKKEELQEQKKKKRAAEKERKKLQEKIDLKMIMEKYEDPGMIEENAMFRLNLIKSDKDLNKVLEQTPDVLAESENESEDGHPKLKKLKYSKESTHLDSSGKFYKEEESEPESEDEEMSFDSDEGLGLKSDSDSDENVKKKSIPNKENENPLLTDLDFREKKEKKLTKAALWFEKDSFKNLETEVDEDYDLDILTEDLKSKGKVILGERKEEGAKKEKKKEKFNEVIEPDLDSKSNSDTDSDSESEDSDNEKRKKDKLRSRKRKLNEEGMAIGSIMVQSLKKKRDLIDGAWNRYAFNDEHLPEWFAEDEKKHMHQNVPVPGEMVSEYKKKLQEINVRPIKKIVEAKARKKRKMLKFLQKAKKKMENIMDDNDLPQREKLLSIKKMYEKARAKAGKKSKEVTYVVAKKMNAGKRYKRPRGVKGRFKVVDPRMKKDARRQKNNLKKNPREKKQKK